MFFVKCGGEVCGEVVDEEYRPFSMPKSGLEIAFTDVSKKARDSKKIGF